MTDVDVLVVGGGLGGVAAAVAAAQGGCRVLVAEPGDRIGGQVTAQAVSALDEHPHVERPGGASRSYAAFRARVRAHYRARYPAVADVDDLNPGGGWVSRLCFEPAVGQAALEGMLAEAGVAVRLHCGPLAVDRVGDRVRAVALDGPDGPTDVAAAVVLDATELGDLLPLADAPWCTGREARADTGEPGAPATARPDQLQACTVSLVVEHRPGEDHTVPAPPGYAALRDAQPFTLTLRGDDGRPRPFRVFADGPTGLPPFWTYRRIRHGALLDPWGGTGDLALLNWESQDAAVPLLRDRPGPDPAGVAAARRLSTAFLHWLQTEAPRDDGGRGYPGLRLVPEATGTPDGLAAAPYVREARRLRALRRVTADDLGPAGPRQTRARSVADSGGIGWYAVDLHRRVGDPTRATAYRPTRPFQVPLSALVAARPGNLVAAAKNIGTTHLANGAFRVHHVEWAVGEAAGTLAAAAVARRVPPAALVADPQGVRAVQHLLVGRGVPLSWPPVLEPDGPAGCTR